MFSRHRRNKGITSAGVVGDVALAGLAIAKGLAKRRYVDPQRAVINDRVGPGVSDQPLLGDRFASVLDQCDQNIERTTTEAHWPAIVEQHTLRRDQPERSEDERFIIHGGTVFQPNES